MSVKRPSSDMLSIEDQIRELDLQQQELTAKRQKLKEAKEKLFMEKIEEDSKHSMMGDVEKQTSSWNALAPAGAQPVMVKIGVIGTAGRGEVAHLMSGEVYLKMVQECERIITQRLNLHLHQVHLISGGAAWAGKRHVLFWYFCR